jgi:hypothetical protein
LSELNAKIIDSIHEEYATPVEYPVIRYGIMCKGTTFQEWQARCIEHLLRLGNVQVALLIVDDTVASQSIFHILRMTKGNGFDKVLFKLYQRFLLRTRALRKVNLSPSLGKVATINCKTMKRGESEYFSEADVRIIRGFQLDFIIKFGFGIVGGEILNAARYGVWAFRHDDEENYSVALAGFWEIYNNDNVTGASLQRLTDRPDAGVVLKKGFLKTTSYSHSRNLDAICFESARWPAQVCIDMRNRCASYLNDPPLRTNASTLRTPGNIDFLVFAGRILRNTVEAVYRFLFCQEHWNIGVVSVPITHFLDPRAKPRIRWLRERGINQLLADPFGILKDGRLTILCEDFDYRTCRGFISSVEFAETDDPQPAAAIVSPVHMSYPYLFEDQSEIYCVPETYQAREVSLYKAVTFPSKWSKVATVVRDFAGLDPTIFRHDAIWWLTCGNHDDTDNHNLYVWYATDLLGPWNPHPGNPVKTDIRSARPAGTPFIHEGHLIRPAQDQSGRQQCIVLNRVTRLTTTEFSEEPIATVKPELDGPLPSGVHTLSAVGNFTLIDGSRFIFVGSGFEHRMAQLIAAIRRRVTSGTAARSQRITQ